MTPAKACTVCGEDKPLTDYSPHRDHPDGRQSACKICRAALIWAARQEGRYQAREGKQRAAWSRATRLLRERHHAEFRKLYLAAMKEGA